MTAVPDLKLTELIAISCKYGSDSAFVLAGGGNTSFKTADRLWVKASGHALATIGADGFVELDRAKLDSMLHGTWPADAKAREAAFIEAVMAARVHPELGQRPSVEALLHHLLPSVFVVHTHPGLVNAITCCVDGEALANELFGSDVLWQPYVDPGLILAKALNASVNEHVSRHGSYPTAIFLANHGLIVGAETADAIDAETSRLTASLRKRVADADSASVETPAPVQADVLNTYARALSAQHPGLTSVVDTSAAAVLLVSDASIRSAALAGPLTPDQIVYCRSTPIFFDTPATDVSTAVSHLRTAWHAYVTANGWEPWLAIVADAGVIAFRNTPALAEISRAVFSDAAGVYANAARLGGVNVMNADQRCFIEEWEVEAYRRAVMAKKEA